MSRNIQAALAFGLIFTLTAAAAASEVAGPMVGAVEATTAHLLYRPANAATRLRLSVLDKTGAIRQTIEAQTSAETDFVAKFDVRGLSPATTYQYKIDRLGDKPATLIAASSRHSFTTADPARSGRRVSVAFVSCVDNQPSRIWQDMTKAEVDTVCLMGDTPYIDNTRLPVVREKHRRFLQMPGLTKLIANTPTVGAWDDHDFGANNGNGLNLMTGKKFTRQGFVNYRAHSQYGDGKHGVYHKVDLGMIEVFLLDPRYFSQTGKSPVDPSQPTCFGATQWKWLLDGLRNSKAPFKVLAMGAIWQDKKNRETDDMFTYWYERDALLNIVKKENISGVTLLGGDIHVARHLIHPRRTGYDLHDFVISPGHTRTITQLDVYHPSLEWSLVEGWQYLTLTADGTDGAPTLTAEFRQPGKVNRKIEIPLSNMTQPHGQAFTTDLRAYWPFDSDMRNHSALGQRLDGKSINGAAIAADAGVNGGAVRFQAGASQYVTAPRSFLDDNSASHTVSMWFKPQTLPAHGSEQRSFLLESTAEGKPSSKAAYHLSIGLRPARSAGDINLQLYTSTLKPAAKPSAAPTALAQGPFNNLVKRKQLLNAWNHIAMTFDSRRIKLYLNGQLAGEHLLPTPGPASEFGGLIIGGHREGEGRNFEGLIDEVKVFQGLISRQQLKALSVKETQR